MLTTDQEMTAIGKIACYSQFPGERAYTSCPVGKHPSRAGDRGRDAKTWRGPLLWFPWEENSKAR